MKNYKLISAINLILSFFLVFITAYLLLSFITKIKALKIITSLMFAISLSLIIFINDYKKNKGIFLKKAERKQFEIFIQKLEIMPDNEVIALLLQIFNNAEIPAVKCKNHLEIKGANCFFDFSKTTNRQTVCNAFKNANGKKIILFCNCLQSDCLDLIELYKNEFFVIDSNKLFALVKKYDILNKCEVKKTNAICFLKKLWAVMKNSFTKKKCVTFTLIGVSLLILSGLTFFPKYYLISALICFTYALICLFFGKDKQKRVNESLPFDL